MVRVVGAGFGPGPGGAQCISSVRGVSTSMFSQAQGGGSAAGAHVSSRPHLNSRGLEETVVCPFYYLAQAAR